MSYTKYFFLLITLLSGCTQLPQTRPPDYKPHISKKDISNFNMGVASLGANDTNKAASIFNNLISDNPEISGPWVNLGIIHYNNNQYQQSQIAASNALKLNPGNPYALNLSGMLARRNGNIKQAHSFYLKAIEYKKDYAIAHYNIALLYDIYFQDVRTAARHYRIYLDLIDGNDKQTTDWLEQIQNSMKKS